MSLDTNFPADAVEFCPHPNAFDILVCGTYKLETAGIPIVTNPAPVESPQRRRGQCLVLQLDNSSTSGFNHIQSIDLPAVLDMKWSHRSASLSPMLGIADSEGSITLHELQTDEKLLKQVDSIRCTSKDTLCLSLDWSNRRTGGIDLGSLVVSLSNGSLCLLSSSETGLSLVNSWHAHDFEPWVAAWNYWNTNVIYSGGDDLKLRVWDIRQGFSQSILTNKRFDAGITSIQSHPHLENLIAVGSYDNTVRLFDTRKLLTPMIQVDVGGGAWRVKWHPSWGRKEDLLVACMHEGVKVIHFDFNDLNSQGQVVRHFREHKSMAYGIDWSFDSSHLQNTVIGSCSFYDHVFYLWSG
ncbi:WD repeat-containing protein 85 [Termitomyces sp. T112]|nr:WD repeat-containing protein 85 [Termitomyces sp. T112]KAH0590723.1 hypothetical protein H2248_000850 [Termitomyces sp. 'cryptogamus']